MDWAEVYDALGCLKASFESRQHSSGMTNIENAALGNCKRTSVGACNTPIWPHNINPTDAAKAPLIYTAISAKCSSE
jgi:hypothetical protein